MPLITYDNKEILIKPDQTVLEALIEAGHSIPNSCRAGICQACKMQALDGSLPTEAQSGLLPAQLQDGLFLACCCKPKNDLTVRLPDAQTISQKAEVIGHELLSENVLCLRLRVDFKWQAGQVINCMKDDTLVRSYSIASVPSDGYVELHVRIYPNGIFGQWAKNELSVGGLIRVEAPFGECVYDVASYEQDLVLVATGTGLAPLVGVIKDATSNHHQGKIDLYLGAGEPSHFYFQQELMELQARNKQLSVHWVVRRDPEKDMHQGNVEEVILETYPTMKGKRFYLCGASEMISNLQVKCFMRGVTRDNLLIDAFEPAIT